MKTINLANIKSPRYKIEAIHPRLPTSIKDQYRLFGERLHIEAKPTNYRGHLFRSRLEARWAVFFDSLQIRWRYEPAAFDLGFATLNDTQVYLGGYIPDFYLPSLEAWVEVKPLIPHSDSIEWAKVRRLVKHICKGSSGFIFSSLPRMAFVFGNNESLLPIINHSSFNDAIRTAKNYQFIDDDKVSL